MMLEQEKKTDRIEGGARLRSAEPREFLVSIITVVFRAHEELVPLIESVRAVKDASVELIVIDGGSNDGTVELLRKYEDVIDYWLSEPDKGIYDAMNKGIALARGEFLLHLNAGDAMLNIPRVQLRALPASVDIAAFRVLVDGKEFCPASGLRLRLQNTLHHQGTFFRRAGYLQYEIGYRIFADFDVNQRLAKRGAETRLFAEVVATHAGGGASDTPSQAADSEFFAIIRRNFGGLYLFPAWFLCKCRGLRSRLDRLFRS